VTQSVLVLVADRTGGVACDSGFMGINPDGSVKEMRPQT
jgi:hypothetical protein